MSDLIGTEHEYSINDSHFRPLPVSDRLISALAGSVRDEIPFGKGLRLSKELQKHVIELVPSPQSSLLEMEGILQDGVRRLFTSFPEYRFLGLGMHPLLTLNQTSFWDHRETEYYQLYHRLFDIRQHGWLNIQALQVNLPYGRLDRMTGIFNKLRSLLPYLVAVAGSSPFLEGRMPGPVDNRLIYYRKNQQAIPLICRGVIPERLDSPQTYISINREIYHQLRREGADILCREWVNSRGIIVRFTRGCVEIKALDEQECLHSDMALAAFIRSLLRCPDLPLEEDDGALLDMLESAIHHGTSHLRPELSLLYRKALERSAPEDRVYLSLIGDRIDKGNLGEILIRDLPQFGDVPSLLVEMETCLRDNRPYLGIE